MVKSTCLLWGDEDAPYHPLSGVAAELQKILSGFFDVETSVAKSLGPRNLVGVDLVVNLLDRWEEFVDDASVDLLTQFVDEGGALLTLHNGVCLARNPRALSLVGAQFLEHPAMDKLAFTVATGSGLPGESFVLHEEPYRYQFSPAANIEPILSYRHEGRDWPAGWFITARNSAVLMPGHEARVFADASWHPLLVAVALRLCHLSPESLEDDEAQD